MANAAHHHYSSQHERLHRKKARAKWVKVFFSSYLPNRNRAQVHIINKKGVHRMCFTRFRIDKTQV
jgi:hypothetical protein